MNAAGAASAPWEPLSPAGVVALLGRDDIPWLVAGGWAIDLFVGRQTRHHDDIDVLVLRRDQHLVRSRLGGWDCFAADPPGTLRPWPGRETLPTGVTDVWCRPHGSVAWRVQLMLDDADGDTWVSRRDPRVRLPLARIRRSSPAGVPYLAPEVQLFYKSAGTRPKDEDDLHVALPLLGPEARAWLAGALRLTSPGHPWLPLLTG